MSLISKFNGSLNVVGKRVKEYRIKRGFSYEELSAKLELIGISIHKQSLYDIENDKRTVKDYELYGLAYILKIDMNDLFVDMRSNFKE